MPDPPGGMAALWDWVAPWPPLPPARASPRDSPLQGPRAHRLAQAISRHIAGSQANPYFDFPGQLSSSKMQLPALPDATGVLGMPKKQFLLASSSGKAGLD